ncbi:hypothetical protein ACJX0J_002666, partial [Zea mays]
MTHINYLMENTKNPVIEKKRYELHNDKNNSYFIFIISKKIDRMKVEVNLSFFSKRFLRIRFFDIEIKKK